MKNNDCISIYIILVLYVVLGSRATAGILYTCSDSSKLLLSGECPETYIYQDSEEYQAQASTQIGNNWIEVKNKTNLFSMYSTIGMQLPHYCFSIEGNICEEKAKDTAVRYKEALPLTYTVSSIELNDELYLHNLVLKAIDLNERSGANCHGWDSILFVTIWGFIGWYEYGFFYGVASFSLSASMMYIIESYCVNRE